MTGSSEALPELGWGILATSRTAWKRALPALERTPGHRIVAIAGRDAEKVRRFASRFGVQHTIVAPEPTEILDLEQVDAVYIPLPNALHGEWTRRALEAGKHVLCEKPLTFSSQELEEILAAQAVSGKFLAEWYSYPFSPLFRAVQEELTSGRLGELELLSVHFTFPARLEHSVRFQRSLGGGSLLDLGCYGIDLAHRLLEESLQIIQLLARPLGDARSGWTNDLTRPVDGQCLLAASSASGADIILRTSLESPRCQAVWIAGSAATLYLPAAFQPESEVQWLHVQNAVEGTVHSFRALDQEGQMLRQLSAAASDPTAYVEEDSVRWRRNVATLEQAHRQVLTQLDRKTPE